MHTYTAQQFSIPKLSGISQKQIDEHLKLYEGYVKHTNLIGARVKELREEDREKNRYEISELERRLGFEFNGMRSHEYYFGALENGSKPFEPTSNIGSALVKQFGSYETWKEILSDVAKTRGSGWAMTYYDKKAPENPFIVGWIDEHHIGYLSSLPIVFALDCWEHAYMIDYLPGERGVYIDAYLENINWETINEWFENTIS